MKKYITIFISLFIFACGSSDNKDDVSFIDQIDNQGKACQAPNGMYKIHFEEQPGGSCGYIEDRIYSINSLQEVITTCKGNVDVSSDRCMVYFDTVCPGSSGYKTKEVGKGKWSYDANLAHITENVMVIGVETDYIYCSSIYNISYSRF